MMSPEEFVKTLPPASQFTIKHLARSTTLENSIHAWWRSARYALLEEALVACDDNRVFEAASALFCEPLRPLMTYPLVLAAHNARIEYARGSIRWIEFDDISIELLVDFSRLLGEGAAFFAGIIEKKLPCPRDVAGAVIYGLVPAARVLVYRRVPGAERINAYLRLLPDALRVMFPDPLNLDPDVAMQRFDAAVRQLELGLARYAPNGDVVS
jgi:hypothetical protein